MHSSILSLRLFLARKLGIDSTLITNRLLLPGLIGFVVVIFSSVGATASVIKGNSGGSLSHLSVLVIAPVSASDINTLGIKDLSQPVEPTVSSVVTNVQSGETALESIVEKPASEKVAVKRKPVTLYSNGVYLITSRSNNLFGGGELVFPKTEKAMSRAMAAVGHAYRACRDNACEGLCDHLAGSIWGYSDYSGYATAMVHWRTAVSDRIAHLNDREPPLGALLFWKTQKPEGHVATYIGNGRVVSNSDGPSGTNVYIVEATAYEDFGYEYLGWADPVFRGEKIGSRL